MFHAYIRYVLFYNLKPILMRIIIYSLILGAFLLNQQAVAQDEEVETNFLDFGLKFGGNFNQFSQPGIILGGNIGGYARLNLIDLVSVQGELLYDFQGGGRHDFEAQGATFQNRSLQLHTVSLPISAKITPFIKESVTPYFLVGGSIEYVAAAFESRDIVFDGGGILTRQNANVSDDLDDIQAGFHVAAGFDFYPQSGRNMGVELRWRQSLMDLNSGRDEFGNTLRPLYSTLYSSTLSVNFYASLIDIF